MRAGVVGCGHVCHQHLRALRRLSGVEIVGVCDRDMARAVEMQKAHGVRRAFDSLNDLLDAASPDVVHVLTPPQTHRAIAVQSIDAGCHVLVEKPMAMSAEESRAMLEVSRRRDRRLGVCHNYLFVPAFLEARRLIERGALGRIVAADIYWRMSTFRTDVRRDAVAWMRELPGGPFLEVLPHLVYLVQAVMGSLTVASVVSHGGVASRGKARSNGVVTAPGAATSHGGDDDPPETELRAILESPRGPVSLGISLEAAPVQKLLRIHGTAMSLHVDLATSVLVKLPARADTAVTRALTTADFAAQLGGGLIGNAVRAATGRLRRGHEMLIERFYESLACGTPIPVGGEDGLATVAVLEDLCGRLRRAG
jgi:predicted dehydrogenase